MYIVAFNGPPGSGKDTLADMLAEHMDSQGVSLPLRFESLSMPLRKIAYAALDLDYDLDGEHYAEFKRQEFPRLGVTGRQLMIDVSERFLKPTYGIEVMAKLLLERNAGFGGILLIRDSGFQCEVDPLIEAVGARNVFIVRVHRDGKTYEGDSRERVYSAECHEYDLLNDLPLDQIRERVIPGLWQEIQNFGWKL